MKAGLSTFLHAPLVNGAYGAVSKLAGAIAYRETITLHDYESHEDNALQWVDNSFASGLIGLTVGHDDTAIFANLLGRKTKTLMVGGVAKSIYVGSINDISKPVGFGFIENIRTKDGLQYGVKFYPNVTFKPYATEGNTKSKDNNYTAQAVEGNIATLEGEYIFNENYSTMEEAIAVLYACFGEAVPSGVNDAGISALTIGSLALSPSFSSSVYAYVASTEAVSNVITVATSSPTAAVAIKNNEVVVANESAITWADGVNVVEITVTSGTVVKVYTVSVTNLAV